MKIPSVVMLAALGGAGLLAYYLMKKKEFPFNEGSIFSELKQDLSNLGPTSPTPQAGGQGALPPALEGGVTPGTIQSNPQAVDLATYQNYLQGLKAAFPDYVPNISSTTGDVIAGDPNLFQNNPINGPPVQPYPGGALMPPFTQQMYPYYRAPMIPEPGSMRPPMGPPPMMPPRPPMGPPPWDDMFYEPYPDRYGRPRRKWPKPKPTESPQTGCRIKVGSICIGYDGSVSMGNGISVGGSGGSSGGSSGSGSGISVGGLMTGGGLGGLLGGLLGGGSGSSGGSIFGSSGSSRLPSSSSNKYGIGTTANSGAIKGQVNSMLDDIFSKVGISR